MSTLNASTLSLNDVHRLLELQEQDSGSFAHLLSLKPLTEYEQQELDRIWQDFKPYVTSGKVSEGVVKAMTTFPLLRAAGYYSPPIRFRIEEGIAALDIRSEETKITGRFDILAVNNEQGSAASTPLWILVIETKEGLANVWAGLPQLLTYAYQSLEHQESVWGLATNGLNYQFVYLTENPLQYQLMPLLNLFERQSSFELLQVLKAIL
ncbi:MAG: restriction endonuclease subunit R [Cyanophyceae cyanobacterium]